MKKHFNQGIGRLDADQLNMMAQAGYAHAEQSFAPVLTSALQGPFLAIVNPPSGIDPQVLAESEDTVPVPFKWGYDFIMVDPEVSKVTDINGDESFLYESNSLCYRSTGREGNASVALNLNELNNSALVQMGVDVSNLPEGFALQPVPGTTTTLVWVAPMPFEEGDTTTPGNQGFVAYFTYPNQFDGDCS